MNLTVNQNRLRAAGIAAIASLGVGLAACGSASDEASNPLIEGVDIDRRVDTSDDGVQLLNDGQADQISLPVAYQPGDRVEMTMDLDATIGIDGRSEQAGIGFVTTQTVTKASPSGAVVETIVQEVDGRGALDGADSVEDELAEIIGVPLFGEVDAAGMPVGDLVRRDGGALPASLNEQMSQLSHDIDFPSEPVGVGAVWMSSTEVTSSGITIEAETRFDLVELTEDHYVVGLTQRLPIDETIDGTEFTGLLEATGTLTVDRDNPLHVDMYYEQSGTYSAAGIDVDVDLTIELDSR